ncbi:DUF2237 domain-containing protein [Nocardioidaceae bacterium]|nr:DUF2237 domain-containing protein [Nocardioidaceae bacterium]
MSTTGARPESNVLGEPLEVASTDPVTGWFRDGTCRCEGDPGLHAICAVMTDEFLAHQVATGNDLVTPQPRFGFAGLRGGDRWCVVAARWLHAHHDGVAPPVVLAATSERALEVVPLEVLRGYAVDVPPDLSSLA